MIDTISARAKKQVAIWLLIGVGMIIIQVVLGGITRLTESGLSITEWKPITGAMPPLNDNAWQVEFDKYKNTDQFKYVHANFGLQDFKYIFFWEWFHRLWARTMGMVFLVGFVYFLLRKRLTNGMIIPMIILFILGGLQGAIGWIMVSSGLLPDTYFVGHIELTTHLMAALLLLCYTLWLALQLLVKEEQKLIDRSTKNGLVFLLGVLFFQLIYGGFMAGLKAAVVSTSWPDMNGSFIPDQLDKMQPAFLNIFYNPIAIHFIHRCLAYVFFASVLTWWVQTRKIKGSNLFIRLRAFMLLLTITQVALGILTILNATWANRLVVLGVSHQFIGMMVLVNLTCLLYVVRKK